MISIVADSLTSRGANFSFISLHDLPGTVRIRFDASGQADAFLHEGEPMFDLQEVRAIYHRVGFANFEVYQEYTPEEVRYVNNECGMALNGWLNNFPHLVVNRPWASGSNASKPFQIAQIKEHGFRVPRTIVTNLPNSARVFYEENKGQVIYKSISYLRSVVNKMTEADLDRLDTLDVSPIQLQEYVRGFDVRVHVIGDAHLYAARIDSSESDYRYDKTSEMSPYEVDDDLAEKCVAVTKALGLEMSGIDLRVTPEGEVFCFEVNPSPAFRFYESRAGLPISDCLAEYLEDYDREHAREPAGMAG